MAKEQPLSPPFKKISLKDFDPAYTANFKDKTEVASSIEKDRARLYELQEKLYAEQKHSVLIVFQAMDTGGKDGAIEHVFSDMNPSGIHVASFKAPTPEELAHDFLWRIHQHTPARGNITIFNRSHYEDVLVVRVHNLVPEKVWRKRYEHINEFEQMLAENHTTILKFYLHISKEEQRERLQARLDDPKKHWKFAVGDLKERELWDDYMAAYEDAINHCHKPYAPWFIIPANKKWFRNYTITRILRDALEKLDPKFPENTEDLSKVVIPK